MFANVTNFVLLKNSNAKLRRTFILVIYMELIDFINETLMNGINFCSGVRG